MNSREMFLKIMKYQQVKRIPVVALEPYENECIKSWHQQGLPSDLMPEDFLDMDRIVSDVVSFYPIPPYEKKILYEDNEIIIDVDYMGCVAKRRKEAPDMYYGYIKFPINNETDWIEYKKRFLYTNPTQRYVKDFNLLINELNSSEYPIGLNIFPFLFRLGFYTLGMDNFMLSFYDKPTLIHEMFSFWCDFIIETIKPILSQVQFDFVTFNEDLAYKNGPFISVDTYEKFWLPYQDEVISELNKHDIPVICLWTAGNIFQLIPTLIDHGFNCIWPCERNAGMDPIILRKTFGKSLRLGGGISKESLIAGKNAIDSEVDRILPLIEEGGYVPAIDDMVPPEVTFENYRYYVEKMRSITL